MLVNHLCKHEVPGAHTLESRLRPSPHGPSVRGSDHARLGRWPGHGLPTKSLANS